SANLALARRYLELRRPQQALAAVGESLDADAWAVRAQALLDLGRADDAAEAARRGLAEAPDDVPLLDLLGLAEKRRGDVAAAERAFLAALARWPEHPTLLAHYAHLLLQAGHLPRARELIAEAERIAPEEPEVLSLRVAYGYVAANRRVT